MDITKRIAFFLILTAASTTVVHAQTPELEKRLRPRVTQEQVIHSSVRQVRKHGLRVFATPFTEADGLGSDNVSAGVNGEARPAIFGVFTRVDGLDSQSCGECHTLQSADTIPNRFAIGGAGAQSNNEIGSRTLSLDEDFTGLYSNSISLFGSGGAELVGFEITAELQALKEIAILNPGTTVQLIAKGVNFGVLVCDGSGNCDFSGVDGLREDLVARPFLSRGKFSTFRSTAVGAAPFHLGMEPVELVDEAGLGPDPDGDGVENELLVGEISAMSIWAGGLPPPIELRRNASAKRGKQLFTSFALGCADCHIPEYVTQSPMLTFAFPEVPTDPSANVYKQINLRRFRYRRSGSGVRVRVYSDFKTHDMGSDYAGVKVPFLTAKLWGVADTAPYLHDGRATTLSAAILGHGGEAEFSAAAYDRMSLEEKNDLIAFLKTLRNPRRPNKGLAPRSRSEDENYEADDD
jgi:cytochrome c peroxidase